LNGDANTVVGEWRNGHIAPAVGGFDSAAAAGGGGDGEPPLLTSLPAQAVPSP